MSDSSDVEYITDNEVHAPSTSSGVKRKRAKYAQKFKREWERIEEFAGWIAHSRKGATFALCKSCNKQINVSSGRDALTKHLATQQHEKSTRAILTQPKITAFGAELTRYRNHVKEG